MATAEVVVAGGGLLVAGAGLEPVAPGSVRVMGTPAVAHIPSRTVIVSVCLH
jgi:hypothetical protein